MKKLNDSCKTIWENDEFQLIHDGYYFIKWKDFEKSIPMELDEIVEMSKAMVEYAKALESEE